MKNILILLFIGLALSSCAPAQPATEQDLNKIVTQTLEALTATAPQPIATVAQASGLPVSYENISFNIPLELNVSATPFTNTDVEYPYINPSGGAMPAHTVFQITNYPIAGDAKIMIFKASEYAAYGQQDVVTALLAGQDATQPLPKPLAPNFHAQAKTVSFQNGHGVRYLTQVMMSFSPVTNQDLFYYYQGATNDGAYFVSAIFHVNASFLVADSNPNSPTPPDGIPFNGGADLDMAKYLDAVAQKLNNAPAENYAPSLILLDKMIASLQITSP